MNQTRRSLLLGAAASIIAAPGFAQSFGSRSMRIVVPFSAAGPTDFIARLFVQQFAEEIGMPVIVENRPGASGNLGTQHVIDSDPDGMTLVHTTAAMQSINPMMYPSARFHPSRDLVPVALTAAMPNVLVVHPNSGVKTIDDLVRKGKQPGAQLTFATFGPGSSPHVYASILRKATGISAIAVPYKGSGNAINDVLAGNIDFIFDSMTTAASHVRSGKLLGLAITSNERSALLPNVPTLKETKYGELDLKFWFTLQVHAKTPKDMIERLRTASAKAVKNKTYIDGLLSRGAEPFYVEPSQLSAFVEKDTQRWTAAAQSIGIKPE
ncbi:Bug family tripartite tricarboxylate transporter substrate binding protein [Noviherbaspirillum saxi]|uniref:Tripartite tricarboxylate transporter substrate binding protein n=1 Tax=Noviherbaspirillum saxi TaxID=2320863 RepID=A0A3A3FLT8_9BURK|nr:tripartite tricarboxylate transporter substrate binding protein [Noviherbaspirillum saxi]RJF92492.1 tripartite tricarboxylate transporter substrate binding protein [Noviherbaspirillum saxi]